MPKVSYSDNFKLGRMLCGMDEANSSHLKYAASPTEHVLHGPVNSVKLALRWPWLPTILAKN